LPYPRVGRHLVASLGTGLLALTASAGPAAAATQRKSAQTQSANATTASAGGGNGGAGIGTPTKAATATGGGAGTGSVTPSSGTLPHLGDRVLKQGMRGHDVRVLQDYLSRVGFYTHVDGQFGPATARNVRAFQRLQAMTPDGIVSLTVSNALRAAVAKAQKSSSAPVGKAVLNSNGTVTAPAGAPATVRNVIAAGNKIAFKPYIYGGGHASWNDSGYDCSGSVSYALHGANLVDSPMASGEFESYGSPGRGRWITIYANASHMYMVIAGMRYDTVAQDSSNNNDRWTNIPASSWEGSFVVRHPTGW
jgi:peptidoglycan hydrolase-like protein with peptidoglycan-binding domain